MAGNYCILIHYHEIAIKGDNRRWFENILKKNIRKQLNGLPFKSASLNAARIFIFGIDESLWEQYSLRLKKVMGLKYASLMLQTSDDYEEIKSTALEIIAGEEFDTFRVSARRQYKNYPMTSQEINCDLGAAIQEKYQKPVKLKGADLDVKINLIKGMAYLGYKKVSGFGGLPVGCSEKALSLISSGIDSPVASFEMLKRGVNLSYIHFHSAPATNRQSIQNVVEILNKLVEYQISCTLYLVPLLEIQQKIMAEAPNKFWVILFRRAMVHLASEIAEKNRMPALLSGESVGQVASQTLSNIRATGDASPLPILRPLAGMNKDDIVRRAEEIGTYEISIEPYEDCCSFFVPIHPETKANLLRVRAVEGRIDFAELFVKVFEQMEEKIINCPEYLQSRKAAVIELND